MTLLRAIALLAVLPALGCGFWAPAPAPLPTLELPEPTFDPPEVALGFGAWEKSALWLAKCPIGSFYLFGSSELAPEGGYAAFGSAVEAAYAESHEVVHEIDLAGVESTRTIALLRRYGTLKAPATLRSRLSPETWALLVAKFEQSDRSSAAVRSLQPWLVSFALAHRASLARGRDPITDIADRVQERAERAQGSGEKPLVGLGTLESQFQMFAALPRGVQETLLRTALGDHSADEILSENPALLPALAAASPDRKLYYEHLIYRRNEQMAERLFQIGIDGKRRFVMVGILHLVGNRGIPALLGQRGYHISRVQ